MGDIFDLAARFSVLDKFSNPVQRMMGQTNRFKNALGGVTKAVKALGAGLAAMGASAVVLSGLKAGAEAAGGFQTEMTRLALISQASAKELGKLEKYALKLGVITEWSPNEAIVGMRALASAGYQTNEIYKAMPAVLEFATAGVNDLSESAKLIDTALKAWNMSADKASLAADKMTRVTNLAKMEFHELGAAIPVVAAAAAQAGQSMDSALAVFGAIRTIASSTQDAAQIYNSFSEAVKAPSFKTQARVLRDFGVDISNMFRDARGEMLQYPEVIDNIVKATSKMDSGLKAKFLKAVLGQTGAKAMSNVLGAFQERMVDGNKVILRGTALVRANMAALNGAADTNAHFAGRMRKTWEGIKKMLSGTLETFRIVLGRGPMKVFARLIKGITNVLNPILAWAQAHQGLVDKITAGLTVFAGFAAVLGTVAAALGVAKLAAAAFGISLSIAIWPVTLVVGGLMALGGAIYFAWKRSETFRRVLTDLWETVTWFFKALWFGIKQATGFGDDFLKPFREFGRILWEYLHPAFEQVRQAIAALFPEIGKTGDGMQVLWVIGSFAGKMIGGAFSMVGEIIKGLAHLIGWVVGGAIHAIGTIGKAIAGISNFFKRLFYGLQVMFADIILWILKKIQSVVSIVPDWVRKKIGIGDDSLNRAIQNVEKNKAVAQASMVGKDSWMVTKNADQGERRKLAWEEIEQRRTDRERTEFKGPRFAGDGSGLIGKMSPIPVKVETAVKEKQGPPQRPFINHGPIHISVKSDDLQTLNDLAAMLGNAVPAGA